MDRRFIHFLLFVGILTLGSATPLDDYVNKPDPTYNYHVIEKYRGPTYTLYTVNMTSQTWKPTLQSQPVWWHYLSITIPDKIDKDSAFMLIDGGSNNNGPPSSTDESVASTIIIATSTNSVGACLKQIPNQPIIFQDDPTHKSRSEDAIIAWTWKRFVDGNGTDPEILLRMPMTKAAVRGMDTIQDLALKMANVRVNRFMVSGASKRGWTTWTTAAVDNRVVGLAPMVMDLLNLVKNLHHYYRSLGGWTFEFNDYYELNFTEELDNPAIQLMANIVDPIAYNARYMKKPKLVVTASGDEFFMIDDAKYYYNQLAGDTYLRMIPNTEHGHAPYLAMSPIRAFYLSVMTGTLLPKLSWTLEHTSTGGRIILQTDTTPMTVTVYYATTLDGYRKDFRLFKGTPGDPLTPELNPVIWLTKYATSLGNNRFAAECNIPVEGWTAFFIQVTFPGVDGSVLEFTTETLIIPDSYPFPDCHGPNCRGVLV